MMRDYAKISCTLWGSRKFRSLPDDAKLLYLYLHTCQHVNSVGCYVLPEGYATADLEWNVEQVRNGIEMLLKADLIAFDRTENLVRIVDFLKYDPFANPKHAAGAVKIAMKLPDCPERRRLLEEISRQTHAQPVLKQYGIDTVSIPYRYPEPEPKPEPKTKPEPKPAAAHDEDRKVELRQRVIAVLGLKGNELNTSGTFKVLGMDRDNWPMRLEVWNQHRLSNDQIILAITGAVGRARQKDPTFCPSSVKYFDQPIATFARDLMSGKVDATSERVAVPIYLIPEHAARDAAIRKEYEGLMDREDSASVARRKKLVKELADLKIEAAA
ncbi:hypothetical protein E4191_03665 [Paracoccus liaowanqingii]|uniref:Uncharacterized protein n=1 Tax=Paracoccus liaowanqingii TaxID=2560053 RepID=A0A4V1BIT5_9RHOB|nr:hypothetical protein [Paracoccus liaowanqingii]QBX33912.1 hypothetical protein E4191_03665 [Paracoccus liaowanqingii]